MSHIPETSPESASAAGHATAAAASADAADGQLTPAQIEADIIRQREQLADTVSALQDKLDVKSQAQYKAAELKDRATTSTGKPRPEVVAVAAGVVVLLVALTLWRRRTKA